MATILKTTTTDATDLELAVAQRDAALLALRRVMGTLSTTAASPSEQAAYSAALALLAEYGIDPGAAARERHELAYAAWEAARR